MGTVLPGKEEIDRPGMQGCMVGPVGFTDSLQAHTPNIRWLLRGMKIGPEPAWLSQN